MDQDPSAPKDQEKNSNSPQGEVPADKGGIDMSKILLPKKEVHDPVNAERINAGALLAAEQKATLKPPAQPLAKEVPPSPKQEESIVVPLETYQGDIEKLVQQKNVSVVSIAAAEAARRAQTQLVQIEESEPKESTAKKWLLRIAMTLGGFVLLSAAAGILFFVYLQTQPLSPLQNAPTSPFILVDDTIPFVVAPGGMYRAALMGALEETRGTLGLPLGLIARVYVAQASTTSEGAPLYIPFDARQFVSILSPLIPQELTRTVLPEPYLLGIHSFDGNQAFLILQVDSYQQGYSGMLKWEANMHKDLAPLFTRTPRARIPEENISTSTPAAQVLQTKFIDTVVENRDVRAIVNENGDASMLWTFLDRSTIVITTNEYTLREIVSRFTSAPASI